MAELKEHFFCDNDEVFPRGYLGPLPSTEMRPYYLKSEADKVIAELDRVTDQKCDELRHSNYKRCLAMAKWCERKRIDAADYRIPREKWNFYDNWHTRWLEFAEQFKEAK